MHFSVKRKNTVLVYSDPPYKEIIPFTQKRGRPQPPPLSGKLFMITFLCYFISFLNSSATNCTCVPTITCTLVLLGRITPAIPADLIFFSSTCV